MNNQERIEKLQERQYQELFGVRKPTFDKMRAILEKASAREHIQGGRPPRLNVLDRLVVTLGYYHDCRTMQNIAFDYDVSKSRISDAVKWVEQTLVRDGTFALPSKRALVNAGSDIAVVIVDATERPTERPKKNQKKIVFRQAKTPHHQGSNPDQRAERRNTVRPRGAWSRARLRAFQTQRRAYA